MRKRIISFLFCILIISLSLAGCKRSTAQTIYETGKSKISSSDQDVASESQGELTTNANNSSQNTSSNEPSSPNGTTTKKKDDMPIVVDGAGTDKNADYTVSGTVTVAVDTSRATDYEALFDTFKTVYPKVTLKFDYFSHSQEDSAAEYLSTRAAAGKLPDVIWDEAGKLPLYLTQGWVYPLDTFVKNDPDYTYIPNNLKNDYTFGGKLYALPHQAQFEAFFINLDVLDSINEDLPPLNWTTDDLTRLLKKGTTNQYSGIEKLFMINTLTANTFDPNISNYGYNPKTKKFDVNGFIKSTEYLVDLRAVPGLEAWALTRTTTGGKSDYAIKFGSSADNAAFNKGLTLFHGVGTWEMADAKKRWSNMDWTMWTVPQSKSSAGSLPMHVDHCFMVSSTKNPTAAFQLLRYLTYSKEGNIARLSMYDSANKGKYALTNNLYYPTTTHPEVVKKFSTLPNVSKVEKYYFDNIGKSYRFDMWKIVPSWNETVNNYINESVNKATDGTKANVSAILTEMQGKANNAMDSAWSDFNGRLKTKQGEFSKANPGK